MLEDNLKYFLLINDSYIESQHIDSLDLKISFLVDLYSFDEDGDLAHPYSHNLQNILNEF